MPDLVGAIVDFGTINLVLPNLHDFEAGDCQNPKHFGTDSAKSSGLIIRRLELINLLLLLRKLVLLLLGLRFYLVLFDKEIYAALLVINRVC